MAGYALHNDYSERQDQLERGGQWSKGKSQDTFAPLGPFLATPDEIGDPRKLPLWLTVNGEKRQHSSTDQMIFDVPTLVSYLSRFMTLLPGDVISTGTPARRRPRLQPAPLPEGGRRGRARHRGARAAAAARGAARSRKETTMKRFGQLIGLRPEVLEEYKRYHAAVWPEILDAIREAGIRNYSIFHFDGKLFAYFEYTGPDDEFEARMRELARAPAHARVVGHHGRLADAGRRSQARRLVGEHGGGLSHRLTRLSFRGTSVGRTAPEDVESLDEDRLSAAGLRIPRRPTRTEVPRNDRA